MVVDVRSIVFWDVMSWSGTIVWEKPAALILRVEDGDSKLLRNINTQLQSKQHHIPKDHNFNVKQCFPFIVNMFKKTTITHVPESRT
jgi:hypothetical protein